MIRSLITAQLSVNDILWILTLFFVLPTCPRIYTDHLQTHNKYLFIFSCVQELELVEDVWRGEVQDLHSQISQLQAENKKLLVSLPLKESPGTEDDQEKPEGALSAAEPLNQSLTEKENVWEVSR